MRHTTIRLLIAGFIVGLIAPRSASGDFIRGDSDDNAIVEITDAIVILDHLFLGGAPLPCYDAGDVNDDGDINIGDPVLLLSFLFRGARPIFAGGLCGPEDRECVILEDTLLQPFEDHRNDAPSIALGPFGEPHVTFSIAVGGYRGFYATTAPAQRLFGAGWEIVGSSRASSRLRDRGCEIGMEPEHGARDVERRSAAHRVVGVECGGRLVHPVARRDGACAPR